MALERDLAIILDFHHYEEMASEPRSHKGQFLGFPKQIAEHYKDCPPIVLFELLNEPTGQLDAALWNEYLSKVLTIVRKTNRTRDVVVGPTFWNAYDWISTLDLPDGEHLMVTFHYYLPFQFTHQGADWWLEALPGAGRLGTRPMNKKLRSPGTLILLRIGREEKTPDLLGEFGAYSKADMDSRIRWTEFVRSKAERYGFARDYWEFGSGFTVLHSPRRPGRSFSMSTYFQS